MPARVGMLQCGDLRLPIHLVQMDAVGDMEHNFALHVVDRDFAKLPQREIVDA
ncbi:hypothetical protein [Dyella subtropica]|uniref:hypothetical protein n=1 Tax=Dyella subtropica TaxID=2992127 RepID=UPI0022549381|nr:hypothetical protein [Dyella subtropica]